MAYIGKKVEETELDNRTVDTMTGDGSDTTMSLSATPISVNNVLVFFNGVMQRPTTDYTLSGSTITFGAAPFDGAVVVAITGGGEHIGRPNSLLSADKIADGAITNTKISGVASSKLTGALPALDGAALTGKPTGYTESTSDPAIDTNPSTGVGTFWVNKSSGEAFCLTDATAGSNVWTNIGEGSGDVEPWAWGGTVSGYVSGGYPNAYPSVDIIEKFSFTSDGNSTDVGNLAVNVDFIAGQSSTTHGYSCGGYTGAGSPRNEIQKFSFSVDGNASDIADLTVARYSLIGQHSPTHGYSSGGTQNVIDKFPFASDSNATDVGDLASAKGSAAGNSSETHGYASAGSTSGGLSNTIEKFAFASDGNASDIADVTVARSAGTGNSSVTHGYVSGGQFVTTSGPLSDVIDRFPFASDTNASDVGNLTVARQYPAGSSSRTHGYSSGGRPTYNIIDKFTFAATANATDVGDLTVGRWVTAGHQV